jgi:hypothetical protein
MLGKRKPIFKRKHMLVLRCFTEKGDVYYTVVNTILHVHRHFDDQVEAIMACKHAANSLVLPRFDIRFRRNVLYLMTGLEKNK